MYVHNYSKLDHEGVRQLLSLLAATHDSQLEKFKEDFLLEESVESPSMFLVQISVSRV